jgi:hypothetical protein
VKGVLILILILFLIGTGIYFFPGWSSSISGGDAKGNPLSFLRLGAASTSRAVSAALQENVLTPLTAGAGKIVSSTQEAIAKKGEAIGGAISQTFSDAVGNAVESAKEGIAGALGITPADPANPLAPDAQLVNLSICSRVPSNTVNYTLLNPFSPPQDFTFTVEWGDGERAQGSMRATEAQFPLTHRYAKSGAYINSFQITAEQQTITVKRKVCVE